MKPLAFAAARPVRVVGPSRTSGLARRRRARAAFHCAAVMVEAVLQIPALPGVGAAGAQQRLRGRAIAVHVAREAFNIPIFELARAAGLDRRSASANTFRTWDRRDEDAGLGERVEQLIISVRTMSENRKLLVSAWTAGTAKRRGGK